MSTGIPTSFFKFISVRGGLAVLEKTTIGYRQALDLNDPFELQPAITHHTRCAKEPGLIGAANGDDDAAWSVARFDRLPDYRERVREYARTHAVLSLSGTVDATALLDATTGHEDDPRRNLLMWAYYGEGHKGLVLEFGAEVSNIVPQAVHYDEERAELTFEDIDENPVLPYLQKGSVWSHEREWRIVIPVDDAMERCDPTCYLSPFPPQALRSVTIGCNAAEETVDAVRQALWGREKYAHVALRRARICKKKFQLEFFLEYPSNEVVDGKRVVGWSNSSEFGADLITTQRRPTA